MEIGATNKPSCPFCDFSVTSSSDTNMYALMQHLELSHPENGQSPFIALDDVKQPGNDTRLATERATSSPTPSGSFHEEDEDEHVYIECPAHCGEAVTLTELSSHMELHSAEGVVSDDHGGFRSRDASPNLHGGRASSTGLFGHSDMVIQPGNMLVPPSPKKHRSHSAHSRHKNEYKLRDWRDWFSSSKKPRSTKHKRRSEGPRRLGVSSQATGDLTAELMDPKKSELGPHAYEEEMPKWLRKQIEQGARITVVNQITPDGQIMRIENVANETPGMVPVLAQLCEQDPALSKVFLCHPGVKHVFKMAREGGFCGYRNIQMMISYIQATRCPGYEHFPGRIPSILDLQELVEQAWDRGINAIGRVETGGIRGTRKYIGTPEAQALFCSLDIGCEANAFVKADETSPVYESVLQAVLQYFSMGVIDPSQKVYQTSLPPIYFQHPGHSLTIVGLEIRKSGSANLLVLDPMFKTSPGISRLVGSNFKTMAPERLLKAYRRGHSYLQKYHSFEILKLNPMPASGSNKLMIEGYGPG